MFSSEVVVLTSLDAISGSRSYGCSLCISGILSLSLSEDEDCSLEDILLTKSYKTVVSEIVFARKLRHAYF